MLLRALREPGAGRPSPLARVMAALVVIALLGVSAPVLAAVLPPVVRWVAGLF